MKSRQLDSESLVKIKFLRFIERNREDRERIESRTKNLSIRFIDFIPLSFHIEIVARKRVTSFNRETDDSSQIYYFPLMEKELKKGGTTKRDLVLNEKRFYIVQFYYIHACLSFCLDKKRQSGFQGRLRTVPRKGSDPRG